MTTPITVPADAALGTSVVGFANYLPLNLGSTGVAASTLTTACQLVQGMNPITGYSPVSVVGTTATGWGEVYSQGNAGAWAAAGSAGTPSGHGFLFDSTLLETNTIISGYWQPSLRVQTTSGTVIATLLVRWYVYNAGVYTAIGSFTYGSQSYASGQADNIASVSLTNQAFNTGDKLYMDVWLNITTNSLTGAGDGIKMAGRAATGLTGSSHTAVITPGYVPTNYTLAQPESATLADATTLAQISVASSDAGTLADTPTLATITPATTDTGAAQDAVPAIGLPFTDAGGGTDAASIMASVPATDSSSLAETLSTGVLMSDPSTGAETLSFATIAPSLSEAGMGADTEVTFEQIPTTDSAALTDSARLQTDPRHVTFITGP